jgi:hypothetical protein
LAREGDVTEQDELRKDKLAGQECLHISPLLPIPGWEEQGVSEDRRVQWGGTRLRRIRCGSDTPVQLLVLLLVGTLFLMVADLATAKGSRPALAQFWAPVLGIALVIFLFRLRRRMGK